MFGHKISLNFKQQTVARWKMQAQMTQVQVTQAQLAETALASSYMGSSSRVMDQRRHQRVKVSILGRYMLSNLQEYPCQTVNMSPGGILLIAPVRGSIGENIILYFEHLGRIEGNIVRYDAQGFAMTINATLYKRDKLASQLTWLANCNSLGLPEDRRHERIIPKETGSVLRTERGREYMARLIDVSLSGAAVLVDARPDIGARVTLGQTPGRVVRHFKNGFAIEFILPLSSDKLNESIKL